MNFEDRFLIALGELVTKETGKTGVKAVSFSSEVYREGNCDTCGYDTTRIVVYYTSDSNLRWASWRYDGDLGELMRKMTA